ncbi:MULTISPECIES: MmcQ/YjbR family DNA-binding protein [unclassified Chelatococcus]|uniref:MmcQ/YjbR family DNA-binding protein n=1 Tax=unclassified Chelatococcus TaxID=2638111 RepID=UPI001BCED44C|nr:MULTISPECIES: MmcQ/YjbR family DNA-binding protein [unclassified Chelatococcus]MBS7695688.1 MmcQ/YjbR family DNA-binding protein [Chelatococcus sp. YT9]MBX3557919.1 MmcQ/YjbR family DNA-binding protein [Chelatococcus sp.]
MPVEAERVRELALSFPLSREAPHMDRAAFRTPRKTFATLSASANDLNLMFDPDLRDFYCEQEPGVFTPVPGGWGRMGITRCDLRTVDEATLISALQAAYRLAAPKPRRR